MTKEEAIKLIKNNHIEFAVETLFYEFEKAKKEAYAKGWNDCDKHMVCEIKEEKLQSSTLF